MRVGVHGRILGHGALEGLRRLQREFAHQANAAARHIALLAAAGNQAPAVVIAQKRDERVLRKRRLHGAARAGVLIQLRVRGQNGFQLRGFVQRGLLGERQAGKRAIALVAAALNQRPVVLRGQNLDLKSRGDRAQCALGLEQEGVYGALLRNRRGHGHGFLQRNGGLREHAHRIVDVADAVAGLDHRPAAAGAAQRDGGAALQRREHLGILVVLRVHLRGIVHDDGGDGIARDDRVFRLRGGLHGGIQRDGGLLHIADVLAVFQLHPTRTAP